jgi:hypothetical protein
VPLDGIVAASWRPAVVDERGRVARVPYELCALVALREAIRRREVWVAGSKRWRDPDSDLPADFEANRTAHYAAIRAPLDPSAFIAELEGCLEESLVGLSTSLGADAAGGVSISTRAGQVWITVPRSVAQDGPRGLEALKDEVSRRWGTVDLLDVFKETDLLTGFTDEFSSVATREIMPREVLRRRCCWCCSRSVRTWDTADRRDRRARRE